MRYNIITFYKFVTIADLAEMQLVIKRFCLNHNILGTVLLAEEGVNGTLYGAPADVDLLQQFLQSLPEFTDMDCKISATDIVAFDRLKVKIKPEIITFKHGVDAEKNSGRYLSGDDWNDMIDDKNTIIIDTRNDYEYDLGTFKNAINPNTDNFSDLPEWLDDNLQEADKGKNVLMFCTGGVRCEKSTAYLKQRGFGNVYHLKGGIIKYLQDAEKRRNYWQGKCFVFDNRITVDEDSV